MLYYLSWVRWKVIRRDVSPGEEAGLSRHKYLRPHVQTDLVGPSPSLGPPRPDPLNPRGWAIVGRVLVSAWGWGWHAAGWGPFRGPARGCAA